LLLPRIQIEHHRCFRDETAIELRPFTIIYGRNQAGKSTLVRLLPLLGDSLASNQGPLDMTSPALRGASFKELGWLGPDYKATQRLGFSAAGAIDREHLRMDIVDEGRGPFVNRVRAVSGAFTFDASWDGPVDGVSPGHRSTYSGTLDGAAWSGPLEFRSLLPAKLPGQADLVREAVAETLAILGRVQWLQANRASAVQPASSRPARYCSVDGSNLAMHLRPFPEVVDCASTWMSSRDIGLGELRVGEDSEGVPRFEVRPLPGWERLPERLAGDGLRALLPVLLCACWAETRSVDGPRMLIVEEPEAQLHPKLQIQLAERLVSAVRSGVPVVVETHSVFLLRALQLAVLHGEIASSDVRIYWVERDHQWVSRVREVEVKEDASLQGWPPGVFEEEQALATEIFEKRWEREEGP